MAENFNIKPFGLNVIPEKRAGDTAKSIEKAIGNLWEPVLDYLQKNENVFSGNVVDEINKLNIQTMKMGTLINGDKEVRNLDTKF